MMPTLKNNGTWGSLDLDMIYKVTNKLLSDNAVFIKYPLENKKHRDNLPCLIDPEKKINVWSIISKMVGKDMTKLAVPVILNEPLSMLQRLCE
mmetsp:Transcript_6883/g.6179  ORF Transcript_6883/g.6179 Transcript_6883/m.6179 type:complete len:93 (-) Transcript_6883:1181-1459(-)